MQRIARSFRPLRQTGGVARSPATSFVVPVLVQEGASVGDGLKRSWALLEQTWGEAPAVFAGEDVSGAFAEKKERRR